MADVDKAGVDQKEENQDQQAEGEEDTTTSSEDDALEEGASDEDDSDGSDNVDDDDAEPETRRDNSFWVGFRKGKKANRTADQRASDKSDKGDDDDADDDAGDDDDNIDPRDRELLQGELEKALDPITKKLADQEDEKELQGYLSGNPSFKPYEKKIRRFMAHPSRQHLPVETVALEVVGAKNLMKLGAQKGKEADSRAGKTKGSGGSTRGSDKAGNVWNESQEDFEARQQRVREKQRD